MSITQIRPENDEQTVSAATGHPRRRLALLGVLLSLSIGFNIYLLLVAPSLGVGLFVTVWLLSFIPYVMACIVVLVTKPQTGRLRWIELGLLLVGGLALRAIVLPVPPIVSHDSWRYLWDARVTLHGYSPYVNPMDSPAYVSWRDFIYNNSAFHTVPTIYPPGAQSIFLLSYLIAPSNLFVLKGIFIGFDMVTCGALAYLLWRKGLDMSRCILYAWCPLPIIEFAIQGHLDATTLAFTALAIICAGSHWRGSRVLTGFLIAMATLTKVYPILFLFVVIRRKDWALLATCFATIIIAYVPYLILGHGQVFGFFATYASQAQSYTQIMIIGLCKTFSINQPAISIIIYSFDVLLVGGISIAVLRWRLQERISMEAGILLLIGAIFAASSFLFPWYTAAFLPWIALQIGPLWTKAKKFNETSLAVIAVWYFTCFMITLYYSNRYLSFTWGYDVALYVLALALVMRIVRIRMNRRARLGMTQDYKYPLKGKWSVMAGTVGLLFGRLGILGKRKLK